MNLFTVITRIADLIRNNLSSDSMNNTLVLDRRPNTEEIDTQNYTVIIAVYMVNVEFEIIDRQDINSKTYIAIDCFSVAGSKDIARDFFSDDTPANEAEKLARKVSTYVFKLINQPIHLENKFLETKDDTDVIEVSSPEFLSMENFMSENFTQNKLATYCYRLNYKIQTAEDITFDTSTTNVLSYSTELDNRRQE